jgi:hypothetical protein
MTKYGHPTWKDVMELRIKLKEANYEYWLNENLFTVSWWLLLIAMVLACVLWWRSLDKSKIMEILLFGLMAAIFSILFDIVGVNLILWGYPIMIVPIVPPIIEIDMIFLPISYMVVYQFCSSWKSFLIAITISALIFSFILEPITAWLGIYEMHNWKHTYSFPIYIFLGVFCKWLIIKIKDLEYIRKKDT